MVHNNNENTVLLHQGRFGLSLLNGLIGSYLEKEKNPLAVKMGFYHHANKLSLDAPLQSQLDFPLSNRVVIFVHGLSNLENAWDYPPEGATTKAILSHYIDVCFDAESAPVDHSYGTRLQQEFGFSPFYLRYNTGLPLDKNGRNFSQLITRLCEAYPVRIDQLVLVGSGMGGSLLSHAQQAAQQQGSDWLSVLTKCIYLGNLNEGSLLALMLQFTSNLVRHLPLFYGPALADWLELRSERSQKIQPFQRKTPVSLHEQAGHFFIRSGTHPHLSSDSGSGLRIPSHSQDAYLEGIAPMRLTHSDRVYTLIAQWLKVESRETIDVPAKLLAPVSEHAATTPGLAEQAHEDLWRKVLLAGVLDLLASAYDRAIELAEELHYSIAEKPVLALEKLPVINYLAEPVDAAQREVMSSMYRSLRHRGRQMHQYASEMVQPDVNPEQKVVRQPVPRLEQA